MSFRFSQFFLLIIININLGNLLLCLLPKFIIFFIYYIFFICIQYGNVLVIIFIIGIYWNIYQYFNKNIIKEI